MNSAIKSHIQEEMKNAMRSQQKERLVTIRLILAAFKQKEVDERIELTDEHVLAIMDKMLKQRRESITMYVDGNRPDLADKEIAEITIIQEFLPTPLDMSDIEALIDKAIQESGATSVKDMGKVMSLVKPQVQGRADVAAVSGKIKERLAQSS